MVRRPGRDVEAFLDDIDDAAEAAAELVARGKRAWDDGRLLRLAGEAIIGRIADAASKLPDEVRAEAADVPWDDIRDMRIVVDHVYHRVDYEILWRTVEVDVPFLRTRLRRIRPWEP